ncbi:heme exporter protein CcmD [Variovorax robiniae]|uniref:Heme exporter protein D n=1 Tax=Variovorax robiniae TaxID=1836199 RepID=A0ABU8X666_9BURK
MSSAGHTFYIVAAYGVTVVLLAAEVWSLVRRSRALAREDYDARRAK